MSRTWILLASLSLAPSALAEETPPPGEARPGLFYVSPIDNVAPEHTRFACRVVREVFALRCRVSRQRPIDRLAYDARRNQFDADVLVKGLFDAMPRDAVGMIALTNHDLFESGHSPFVFGLASLVDHVGIVSLARYRATFWGKDPDRVAFYERYYKVLVHEVGHTLGLTHCPNESCVMRKDSTLADLDRSPQRFCKRCRGHKGWAAKQGPGTATWHYMRGHSYLERGRFARAVYHLEQAAELDDENPRVLNDLGVAYLRRGDAGRALWYFRHAQRLDPGFAHARYNEGLVFVRANDVPMAQQSFESALSADPDWALAHRQLGYLAQQAGEPDMALEHFEAWLDAHGEDPSIQERIRMIKGGGVATP